MSISGRLRQILDGERLTDTRRYKKPPLLKHFTFIRLFK
jgi:hypothetical protein